MSYGRWEESEVVLGLGVQVHNYLNLTLSDEGWESFLSILEELTGHRNHPRIRIKSVLTRSDGYGDRKRKKGEDPNSDFRLYDFPKNPKEPDSPLLPGRMSLINAEHPELLVSLHMTPAGRGHEGGMAAVLSPGYETFDLIRRIHLDLAPFSEFASSPWYTDSLWLITEENWSVYQSARSDAWVYFHGYRSVRDGSRPWKIYNRGFRYNMVDWIYADERGWEKRAREKKAGPYSPDYNTFEATGPFWERERSMAEHWRREEKNETGFGGDNHFASDELLRFIQYRLRNLARKGKKIPLPGPIQKPYVSAYSLPAYVNAITAYLEVGYLNRTKDRKIVVKHVQETAGALAAGIYSLFVGLEGLDHEVRFAPRGRALQLDRYKNLKEGNYFTIVTE